MFPAETVTQPFAHQPRSRMARGAIALATAAFATTMRAWIGLLNVNDRVSIARRRKAAVRVRGGSSAHRAFRGVIVTLTGQASGEE